MRILDYGTWRRRRCHRRRAAGRNRAGVRAQLFRAYRDYPAAKRPEPGRAVRAAWWIWPRVAPRRDTTGKKWPPAHHRPEPSTGTSADLLFQEALHVNGVDAANVGFRSGDFHDVGEVIGGGFAEFGLAVAARIVLLIHQHVDAAILREQADGLAVIQT